MAKMKLITKAVEKLINKFPIGSQDGKGLNAVVICKFFLPCSNATWYILEGKKQDNGDYLLYGLVTLYGDEYEYGYISFNELQSLKVKFWGSYLFVERDISIENDLLKDILKYASVLKQSLSYL